VKPEFSFNLLIEGQLGLYLLGNLFQRRARKPLIVQDAEYRHAGADRKIVKTFDEALR